MRITVVVPFHSNVGHLEQCLVAIRQSMPEAGTIVAADRAVEDCRTLARRCQAGVLEIRGPSGPAGLGAIRAPVFRMVGGFDERFRRPSIEDIELGYRSVGAGRRIRLDPRFRGTHLT